MTHFFSSFSNCGLYIFLHMIRIWMDFSHAFFDFFIGRQDPAEFKRSVAFSAKSGKSCERIKL